MSAPSTPEQERIWVALGWVDFVGPCARCGGDHGGFHRDFPYGHLRCLHERSATSDGGIDEAQRVLEESFAKAFTEGLQAKGINVDEAREAGVLPPLL